MHLLAVLAVVAAVFTWTATLDYVPLTLCLNLVVGVLAGVCWWARRAAMLGPTGGGVAAWLWRIGGYLLAGGIVVACVVRSHAAAGAGTGLLALAAVLASYLLGLMTVFAGPSVATARTRVTAFGCGLAAAAVWLVAVFVVPPIPSSIGGALALTTFAAIAAAALNTGRTGSPKRATLAAVLAGAIAAGLIVVLVVVLATVGPANLIPHLAPHALTPADRLAQSRDELFEPYMVVLVFGCFLAAALAALSVATRRVILG
jgi:hypothetical protein